MTHAAPSLRLPPAVLIELMRLASPALPVGGFSYSEALEAAIDHGRVTDVKSARPWLLDQLDLSLARCDLPVWQRPMTPGRAATSTRSAP